MKLTFHDKPPISKTAVFGLLLAFIAAVTAWGSGLGSRWDWWPFGTGFKLLQWAVYIAIAATLFSLWGLFACRGHRKRGRLKALLAILICLPVIIMPMLWINKARSVPPIHDITTDTANPPQFKAILPLRKQAPNSAQYAGSQNAELQSKAYPDIQPITVKIPTQKAFTIALQVAHDLGWNIVAENPTEGRIEAIDTTFWFGFKDDIVIRIKPAENGARLDIRSESRVGRSDIGTNAQRIRRFTGEFLKHIN